MVLGLVFVASEVRFNWLSGLMADFPLGKNPNVDAVDWTSLQTELESRGLLDRPGLVVAALKWHEAGKIDYALGGRIPVNTGGGLLNRGHPLGATGVAQIVELSDQLRRRSGARQVDGARTALAHINGGFHEGDFATSGITILAAR